MEVGRHICWERIIGWAALRTEKTIVQCINIYSSYCSRYCRVSHRSRHLLTAQRWGHSEERTAFQCKVLNLPISLILQICQTQKHGSLQEKHRIKSSVLQVQFFIDFAKQAAQKKFLQRFKRQTPGKRGFKLRFSLALAEATHHLPTTTGIHREAVIAGEGEQMPKPPWLSAHKRQITLLKHYLA